MSRHALKCDRCRETPLRLFLQASMLSTDTETKEDEKDKEVSIIIICISAYKISLIAIVESYYLDLSRSEGSRMGCCHDPCW